MIVLTRTAIIGLLSVILVSCTQNSIPDVDVNTARNGAHWAQILGQAIFHTGTRRPGALLGTYIATYLSRSSTYRSALAGIELQMALLFSGEPEKDEAYAVLEELGTVLQVDVPDMLNRSIGRPGALDTYIRSLAAVIQEAKTQLERLEQELDELEDERRVKRREAAQIQSNLNSALRKQDYSTASELQQQIAEAEAQVTRVESREDEQRSIIKLYRDLLGVATQRGDAIAANREALLKGITVVELPGVSNLGLIRRQSGRRGHNSSFGDSLFDL